MEKHEWSHTQVQQLRKTKQLSYHTFDIVDLYPSITDYLLIKKLKWAQKYHNITETEFETIIHARRTILYDHKGNSKNQFDVSMEANDGVETCELIGLYILTEISKNRFYQGRIIPRRQTSSDTIYIWKLLG